jgi:D-methionine transport system substrate-binding protein
MKKKLLAVLCIMTLCLGVFSACGSGSEEAADGDMITLRCLADTTPHKEILEHAAPALEEQGIKLEIVSETWDETWNEQVENGDVDFHFDAYQPYLDEWNEANNGHLIGAGANPGIHFEPLVMMSEKYDKIEDVPDNAVVAVKNDATNEYRCLKLLEKAGWIELSDDLTLFNASTDMVTKYVKPIKIVEMDADVIMQDKQDFDVYLTNTNRLLDAGLDPLNYLIREDAQDNIFANVIAVNSETYDKEVYDKVLAAIQTDEMREWINENYKGAVLPAF